MPMRLFAAASCFLVWVSEAWVLQLAMQTQNSNAKMLQNAAVLKWHKDTQEEARLARYA